MLGNTDNESVWFTFFFSYLEADVKKRSEEAKSERETKSLIKKWNGIREKGL